LAFFLPFTLLAQLPDPADQPGAGVPDIQENPDLSRPHDVWGGKWDDGSLVFVRDFGPGSWHNKGRGDRPPAFRETRITIQYGAKRILRYTVYKTKTMPSGYLSARHMHIRFGIGEDRNAGMIYDSSGDGRMANLVKINGGVEDIDTYDIALAGWKPGHLPLEEARRVIMQGDDKLLGYPEERSEFTVRTAADEVLADARFLEQVKAKWVAAGNDPGKVTWAALKPLIHPYHRVAVREGQDLYGRPFTLGNATQGVTVHPETHALLSEAYPHVWGAFAPRDPQP
jgi:hypothetical protein